MTKTLIGRLQLIIQATGLGEGKKVESTLQGIQAAAKRLDSAKWGANFQRQMDKLALGAKELNAVRLAFNSLEKDMRTRGLTQALQKSEISKWQSATLSHFAGLRSEMQSTEKRAEAHVRSLRRIMRPIGYAAGVTGVGYGAGMALRRAATAASEQTRTRYRMDLANIPPAETEKMSAEASRLSTKYPSIDETSILELNKTALALFGGNGDRARAMMEPVIRAFVADMTAVGVDKAGENLNSFLKAMDNLNVNEGADGGVDNMQGILDGWIKAKQVEGKDIDVGDILGFARRAKVAKYALSDEFLANVLPALGQDMGFDSLGDALSGAYQNLVTPSSGGTQGQYVERQQAAGLRDKNNSLIERDRFAANPYEWTLNVLKPLLAKNGVDTGNTPAVGEAVRKLMSNSKAAGAVIGWIEAQAQIDKNIALYKGATGLGDAENARQKDPMIAQEAFFASLRNLSAAVLPMTTIAAGLNTFADTINAFKDRIRAQDPAVIGTAGALGAGAAAWGTWKMASGIWGLITAGASLQTAAAMLQAAAVSQGAPGTKGASAAAAAGGKGGWANALGLTTFMAGLATAVQSLGDTPGDTFDDQVANQAQAREQLQRLLGIGGSAQPGEAPASPWAVNTGAWRAPAYEPPKTVGGQGDIMRFPTSPAQPTLDTSQAVGEAGRAGQQIKDALSVSAAPQIDLSAARALLGISAQILANFRMMGSAAARARAAAEAEMRRSYSDYGIAP